MNKLDTKIWYGIFSHKAYSVVAQKIYEDDRLVSWVGFHIIEKYSINHQSYEFIQLARNNKFCVVSMTIDKQIYKINDGLNPSDFKDYALFCFNTEEKLYEICDLMKVDASKFTQGWRCEYPFD
ncbi:hypothetical protein AMS59_23685 [Lysinibacillus sp. FJAT-14745]|uniref:hypothetical protein n=1 Tax=Lysinibacillus sp. FJAT-14745 TaxID=1704289 RepID=UPI0006AB9924|nr:hypothetical protein [Lysinibacillus sp. FJAT-14745]KOP69376.1 hypothetical protein AMS59_23685 [Lysinibacillus sp. FJAT-14745]